MGKDGLIKEWGGKGERKESDRTERDRKGEWGKEMVGWTLEEE